MQPATSPNSSRPTSLPPTLCPTIIPSITLLNGFPGVGKLTIARSLQSHIQNTHPTTTVILLDNHQIIDRAEAIFPGRGPEHQALRKQFRQEEFLKLKMREEEELVVIMTACLEDIEEHYLQVREEYLGLARGRGVPFVVVDLCCEEEVNVERIGSEERRCGVKRKLVDEGILKGVRRDLRMLDLGRLEVLGVKCFGIDITRLTVEGATEAVREHLIKIE